MAAPFPALTGAARCSAPQSSDLRTYLRGLWLPLVTPFRDGALDEASLRRLVRHYRALPVGGLVLAATTGESLTLELSETERLVTVVRDAAGSRLPLCLGLSGSNTIALLRTVAGTAGWPIDFYLISCPYYSRPSQQGLALHFRALADRADGGILAAAHVETASFAEIGTLLAAGRRDAALALWQSLEGLTRLLFAEPSPAPIKHWLWRSGLIDSAEVRLPMMEASKELAARIDLEIERRKATSTGAASSAIRKLPADCDTGRAC